MLHINLLSLIYLLSNDCTLLGNWSLGAAVECYYEVGMVVDVSHLLLFVNVFGILCESLKGVHEWRSL